MNEPEDIVEIARMICDADHAYGMGAPECVMKYHADRGLCSPTNCRHARTAEAIVARLRQSPGQPQEGGEWVLVPREQLMGFTALRYVNERLGLVYSGKGRADGRPEVIDEIWAIIHNLTTTANELIAAAPSPTLASKEP